MIFITNKNKRVKKITLDLICKFSDKNNDFIVDLYESYSLEEIKELYKMFVTATMA